ncbi:MAG TPA: HAMP domain-containing sensor histidine kinase [Gammaproteobacteria bacterium]
MFSGRLNNIWHSATFRLGIRFMALFAVSFLIVGAFIFWQTESLMQRELRGLINAEIVEMRGFYTRFGPDRVAAEIEERQEEDPFWVTFMLDEECRPIAGNSEWMGRGHRPFDLCQNVDEEGWVLFEVDIEQTGTPGSSGSAYDDDIYGRLVPLSDQHDIIVGRMAGNLEDAQNIMFDALMYGVLVTIGLALIGSVLMARSVNNRLENMNRISREIRRGDLTRRMPTSKGGDEFDRLGGNLNEMLDQIESLMAGVRDVSNAIAHDLRTPLTRLRTHLEQLHEDATDVEMRARIEETLGEADSLLSTFSSLLRIVQIEAGNRRREFCDVDFTAVIDDVVELYEPLAADKDITLTAEAPVNVHATGDRDLLFQAISNLVDNAIKYTPTSGSVTIRLSSSPASAIVEVADTGSGIPESEQERVFDRFYRLEKHRGSRGSGLGLSLVSAAVSLHGGSIALENGEPGLRVWIELPLT